MQLQQCENKSRKNLKYTHNVKSINVHEMYNLLSVNHNEILQKKSFFVLKQTVRMQSESVIIINFNLYYSHRKELLYFRQHLLLNNLLIIMRFANAILLLFKNIVTRNYQDLKIIINLSFIIAVIAKRLKFCEIVTR